jgi:SPP1 family predicted phage head-tail adaptor
MSFSAGDLVERVLFEKRAPANDGKGNTVAAWAAQFTRSARFLMRPGDEATRAARLEGLQPLRIIVRFDSETKTITNDWRAVDMRTNRVYTIKAAEDMDRKRQWITVEAMEGDAP